jgi:integral membrane protein
MMNNSLLTRFTQIAFIEGVSTIILFFIAMPLKYIPAINWPLGVKYVGWAHGVLFIAYILLLVSCWYFYKWNIKRFAVFFIASLIPFAPFWVERKLKTELQEPVLEKQRA